MIILSRRPILLALLLYEQFIHLTKGSVTYHRIALTEAERTEKNAKNVYPVEKVVSMAMKVVAEGVRSA